MTTQTTVAISGPPLEIPVTRHASMTAVEVVSVLDAMTLGTQHLCLIKAELCSVGQMEFRAVLLVVTGVAGGGAVSDFHAAMKILGHVFFVYESVFFTASVTGDARNTHRRTLHIMHIGVEHTYRVRQMYIHRMWRRTFRNRRTVGPTFANRLIRTGTQCED